MITLAEGKELFQALSTLSNIGLFPFGVDVNKGQLSRPSWRTKITWFLALLLRLAYIAQSYYNIISIYILGSDHAKPSGLHITFGFACPVVIILEIYLSVFKVDSVLVFNEIFRAEKGNNCRRPWKKMSVDDLIVRLIVPTIATLSPWVATATILIAPKLLLRIADLPRLGGFQDNSAFRFVSFMMDVYCNSLVIIQFHVEVFLLIITCSKIVGGLVEAGSTRRYQGIRKERNLITKTKGVLLYCSLANDINSWIAYTVKMICLSCTVSFMFAVITQFGQNIGFSFMFLYASCLTTICYGTLCYFANQVTNQMDQLKTHLASKISADVIPEHRLELRASIKSLKVVPVRVGSFHAMERESFLIFVDFVVGQLVSLLILHTDAQN